MLVSGVTAQAHRNDKYQQIKQRSSLNRPTHQQTLHAFGKPDGAPVGTIDGAHRLCPLHQQLEKSTHIRNEDTRSNLFSKISLQQHLKRQLYPQGLFEVEKIPVKSTV